VPPLAGRIHACDDFGKAFHKLAGIGKENWIFYFVVLYVLMISLIDDNLFSSMGVNFWKTLVCPVIVFGLWQDEQGEDIQV
jgi:hypothetical protein